jgi:hypothetical protein
MEAEPRDASSTRAAPLSLRGAFRIDTPAGRMALAGAALFVITPSLAFFGSNAWLVLFVPGVALSAMGLRGMGTTRASSRLAQTGFVIAFNGVLLIVALFVLGFIEDFLLSSERGLRSEVVGLSFTIVHVMLGVGLLLVDHYRHLREG